MNFSYTQLTAEERYHIELMIKQGKSIREIARGMERSHTTIGRELRRNTGKIGYRHKQAHGISLKRHKDKPKSVKLDDFCLGYITAKLKELWSPEQICGRLSVEYNISLSP